MKLINRFAMLLAALLVPGVALAHAGHLDTIEHAVLHMLEHNGKELGAVLFVVIVLFVGLLLRSNKVRKNAPIKRDKK